MEIRNIPATFVFLSLLICFDASAVWVETGGDPGSGTAFATFNNDITFEISPAGSGHAVIAVVIDEAVASSDGSRNILGVSGLTYSVNGGSSYALASWSDNAAPDGDISENDSFFANFSGPFVSAGDMVTLHAGTATVTSADPDFNLFGSGDYTMFLVNDADFRISYDAVPEPSTIMLSGFILFILLCVHRIRHGRPILLSRPVFLQKRVVTRVGLSSDRTGTA